MLVYLEESRDVQAAITREKQNKGWRRTKESELIGSMNPKGIDLSSGWYEDEILR